MTLGQIIASSLPLVMSPLLRDLRVPDAYHLVVSSMLTQWASSTLPAMTDERLWSWLLVAAVTIVIAYGSYLAYLASTVTTEPAATTATRLVDSLEAILALQDVALASVHGPNHLTWTRFSTDVRAMPNKTLHYPLPTTLPPTMHCDPIMFATYARCDGTDAAAWQRIDYPVYVHRHQFNASRETMAALQLLQTKYALPTVGDLVYRPIGERNQFINNQLDDYGNVTHEELMPLYQWSSPVHSIPNTMRHLWERAQFAERAATIAMIQPGIYCLGDRVWCLVHAGNCHVRDDARSMTTAPAATATTTATTTAQATTAPPATNDADKTNAPATNVVDKTPATVLYITLVGDSLEDWHGAIRGLDGDAPPPFAESDAMIVFDVQTDITRTENIRRVYMRSTGQMLAQSQEDAWIRLLKLPCNEFGIIPNGLCPSIDSMHICVLPYTYWQDRNTFTRHSGCIGPGVCVTTQQFVVCWGIPQHALDVRFESIISIPPKQNTLHLFALLSVERPSALRDFLKQQQPSNEKLNAVATKLAFEETAHDAYKVDFLYTLQTIYTPALDTLCSPHCRVFRQLHARFEDASYYQQHGLKWQHSGMFYGAPGTGKSAMIGAIAELFHRDVIMIDCSKLKFATELQLLFVRTRLNTVTEAASRTGTYFTDCNRVIYVFDEIDRIVTDPSMYAALLTLFDGVSNEQKRLIYATTNHFDRLPPELVRPLRLTPYAFTLLTPEYARQQLTHSCPNDVDAIAHAPLERWIHDERRAPSPAQLKLWLVEADFQLDATLRSWQQMPPLTRAEYLYGFHPEHSIEYYAEGGVPRGVPRAAEHSETL